MGDNVQSLQFQVEIHAQFDSELLLSKEEREEVTKALGDDYALQWLPGQTSAPNYFSKQFAIETAILVFVGIGATAFVRRIGDEAGKAVWEGIKRLISGIRRRQLEHTYRVAAVVYVVVQHGDNFIALELRPPPAVNDGTTEANAADAYMIRLGDILSQQASQLAPIIAEFSTVAPAGEPIVYRIMWAQGRWRASPIAWKRFHERLPKRADW